MSMGMTLWRSKPSPEILELSFGQPVPMAPGHGAWSDRHTACTLSDRALERDPEKW